MIKKIKKYMVFHVIKNFPIIVYIDYIKTNKEIFQIKEIDANSFRFIPKDEFFERRNFLHSDNIVNLNCQIEIDTTQITGSIIITFLLIFRHDILQEILPCKTNEDPVDLFLEKTSIESEHSSEYRGQILTKSINLPMNIIIKYFKHKINVNTRLIKNSTLANYLILENWINK